MKRPSITSRIVALLTAWLVAFSPVVNAATSITVAAQSDLANALSRNHLSGYAVNQWGSGDNSLRCASLHFAPSTGPPLLAAAQTANNLTIKSGGAITSTDKAVQSGANSLSTASLTTSDLQNQAAYKASSISISVGSSGGGGGVGNKSGDANSTTQSGISGGSITIGGKTTDTTNTAKSAPLLDSSGKTVTTAARTGQAETGIKKIFNQQAVEADVAAQVAITKSFGQQASKAVGDYGASKTKPIDEANRFNDLNKRRGSLSAGEAKQLAAMEANGFTPTTAQAALDNPQNQADYAAWKEGGPMRVAAHALVGGITGGNLSSAAGAATSQAIVPILGEQIARLDMPQALKSTLIQVAGIAVGAATGGVGGAVTAQNATANNYLKHTQWKDLSEALKRCAGDKSCEKKTNDTYIDLSAKQDAELATCAARGDCQKLQDDVAEGTKARDALIKSGALAQNYSATGGMDLQSRGVKLANNPEYRAQVSRSIEAQYVCSTQPDKCNEKMKAVALGAVMVAGVALVVPSLPAMAASAKLTVEACAANPPLCLAQASNIAADIAAGDAVGGATLGVAGTAAGARALAAVKNAGSEAKAGEKVIDAAKAADASKNTINIPQNLKGLADTDAIRFTQDSISGAKFSDDKLLKDTIDALRSGKLSPSDLPPIRVFEQDGLIYTLDNRRLFVASQAGVKVNIVPATAEEIAKESGRKMNTPNAGAIVCLRGICN